MGDDDLTVLSERSGWTVAGNVAIYRPVPDGWFARLARMQQPSRATFWFHVALVSPTGAALYVQYASTVGEGRRVAEGWVRSKH